MAITRPTLRGRIVLAWRASESTSAAARELVRQARAIPGRELQLAQPCAVDRYAPIPALEECHQAANERTEHSTDDRTRKAAP